MCGVAGCRTPDRGLRPLCSCRPRPSAPTVRSCSGRGRGSRRTCRSRGIRVLEGIHAGRAQLVRQLAEVVDAVVDHERRRAARGIRHIRTRPYTPRTNGKAERVIQTLLREWAYRFEYQSSEERRRWLAPYMHFYNYHRAHSALGYNPPISRLGRNNLLRRNS